ncbi:hypothetical protein PPL_05813 [Heterostelium album PN500]|uniref:DUF3447 domain-containing protein n=1 Tax=Heterostelium pallidum (strain ATCC 26659 / Pp 5 / PN500) TaxID=670386 RepID=D3BBE7_HETP5|nr:hypothetical protein PPL_05813 [Heterostelium album PN500]EFA80980.1 hypothetical protein PPL_05813 [Heterostelium album PN500]|eukprot:XP_020433098.1 hypothetical protein PPL_05813 [Heterostelium album PN500]
MFGFINGLNYFTNIFHVQSNPLGFSFLIKATLFYFNSLVVDCRVYGYSEIDRVDWIVKNKYYGLLRDKFNFGMDTLSKPTLQAIKLMCSDTNVELSLIDHCYQRYLTIWSDEYWAVDSAAESGRLELVQWLLRRSMPFTNRALEKSASGGFIDVVKLLHEADQPLRACRYNCALDLAAENGHLEVVKFLSDAGYGCSVNAIDNACKGNHMQVVEYLLENRTEGFSMDALAFLATSGSIQWFKTLYGRKKGIMKKYKSYLRIKKWRFDYFHWLIISNAISAEQLEFLRYLEKETKIMDACQSNLLDTAATKGNLEIFKLLVEQYDMNKTNLSGVLEIACWNGNLEIVRYMVDNLQKLISQNTSYIDNACINGKLELVLLLLSKGYPYCNQSMINAAYHGHIDIFKHLLTLPQTNFNEIVNGSVIEMVARNGHLDILKYIDGLMKERNITNIQEYLTSRAVDEAASNGQIAVFDYLVHDHHCSINSKQLVFAAGGGSFDMVKYLMDKHREIVEPSLPIALELAVHKGFYSIVTLLHEYNQPIAITNATYNLACVSGNLSIIKFLESHYPAEDLTFARYQAYMKAVEKGDRKLLEFLTTHGRGYNLKDGNAIKDLCISMLKRITSHGDIEMYNLIPELQTIVTKDLRVYMMTVGAIESGNFGILEDLEECNNENIKYAVMHEIAKNGNCKMFKYLMRDRQSMIPGPYQRIVSTNLGACGHTTILYLFFNDICKKDPLNVLSGALCSSNNKVHIVQYLVDIVGLSTLRSIVKKDKMFIIANETVSDLIE